MTYAEYIDNLDYADTNGFWNNFQHSSASGSVDISSPKWIKSLEQTLDNFRTLQAGWDSYGGIPVNDGAIEHAKQFLNNALFSTLDMPFVTPTSCGGVQVEWTRNNKDLEITFLSLTELHYFYSDSNKEEESELYSNFEEARIAAREFID